MQNTIAIATLWVVPKTCEFFYEKPASENDYSYQFRCRFSELLQNTHEALGEKERFFVKDIMGDNAWISTLAFSILLGKDFISTDQFLEKMLAIVSGSAVVWGARYSLAHVLYPSQPSIAAVIAPRYVGRYHPVT